MTPHPIEIIGGGLAGLSLGLALRRHDIPVLVHEAGDYPRHRVCGEFITGLASSTIERLGLEPALRDALHHREVAWTIGDGKPRVQRLREPALGLSRHTLDARLADLFVASGGRLQRRSRVEVSSDRPGVVIATGRRRAAQPVWIGLKAHFSALPLTRELEMHSGDQGYLGLARVAEGVNVCGLFRRRPLARRGSGLLLAYVRAAGLVSLAERLAAATCDENSFCAVAALDFTLRAPDRTGIFLGDAGAAIPPFTGNGMAMAFQGAELALAPLLAYSRGESAWPAACTTVARASRRRFRLRLASARVLHPFLLQPRAQRWFRTLSRARLVPFGSLHAALH